jgi:hypothetical protein
MKVVTLLIAADLLAGAIPLRVPSVVVAELPHLSEIRSVAALPPTLRSGRFVGADGVAPSDWRLAEPGAPFNSGDANRDPQLPSRQLVFAGCDTSLCVLHYRRGGSGESDNIVALVPIEEWKTLLPWTPAWKVVWFASGHPPLLDLDALRKLVNGTSGSNDYSTAGSRGDLF